MPRLDNSNSAAEVDSTTGLEQRDVVEPSSLNCFKPRPQFWVTWLCRIKAWSVMIF